MRSRRLLPPALVIGAGRDPLRDDARAYAARLDADGVDVTHIEYAGTMHAFLLCLAAFARLAFAAIRPARVTGYLAEGHVQGRIAITI